MGAAPVLMHAPRADLSNASRPPSTVHLALVIPTLENHDF